MTSRPASLALRGASARCWPLATRRRLAQAKEQFFPLLVYRTGAYAPNGTPWANGYVDYLKLVNAQRRHQRRQAHVRGMRDRLRHRPRRRVLRAAEGQARRRDAVPAAVDRHHLRADREGAGRQDPAASPPATAAAKAQDGSVFKWNFPLAGTYWVAADVLIQHIAKKEGGFDKLKGKKIALVYHDSPYGKEPIPLLQERAKMHGFELQLMPVTAPGRRAEGGLAADPPEPARLRAAVGLGRDELDRAQGSAGHRLSAREDVRRLVGRRRARRQGRRRRRQGLQRAGAAARRGPDAKVMQDIAQAASTTRARAPARRKRSAQVLYTRGADDRDARRRRRAPRAGALRQGQGDDRRAGALGPREPRARPEEARRARLRRRDAADLHLVRRPHGRGLGAHPHLGRQQVGLHVRLAAGRRADHQADGQGRRPTSTPPRRSSTRRTPGGLPEPEAAERRRA